MKHIIFILLSIASLVYSQKEYVATSDYLNRDKIVQSFYTTNSTTNETNYYENYKKGYFSTYLNKTPVDITIHKSKWYLLNLNTDSNINLVFLIQNNFFDTLAVFVHENDSLIYKSENLSWNREINTSNLFSNYPSIYMKLNKDKRYSFFIKIFRKKGKIVLPVVLYDEYHFYKFYQNKYSLIGFFTGVIFIAVVVSIALFYVIREKKYIIYGLYALFTLSWRLLEEGFIFGVFQQIGFMPNQIVSFSILSVSYILHLLIVKDLLLNYNYISKHIHKITYFLISYILILGIIWSIILKDNTYQKYISYSFYLNFLVAYVIVYGIYKGIKNKNKIAYIYLISSTPILIYLVIKPMEYFEIIKTTSIFSNIFLYLIFFEIVVLGIAIFVNFKKSIEEKQSLLNQVETAKIDITIGHKKIEDLEKHSTNEKKRISRDLHDSIGAEISNIIYVLDYLKIANKSSPQLVEEKLSYLSDFARGSMSNLRSAIWVLNQNDILIEKFVFRLREFLNAMYLPHPKYNVSVQVDEKTNHLKLSSQQALFLHRIIQETATNTIKYAEGNTFSIVIERDYNLLKIVIQDNGIGFDMHIQQNEKYGIFNIFKRVDELQGKVELNSSSSNGTRYTITIPIIKELNYEKN